MLNNQMWPRKKEKSMMCESRLHYVKLQSIWLNKQKYSDYLF